MRHMNNMATQPDLEKLFDSLRSNHFKGDIESDLATRIVASTDNSIYQLLPQAILYPKELEDINRVMSSVHKMRGRHFNLCVRGGGTGTNGQSLGNSLILDCSRYLNRILNFDENNKTVTIEPGVVLDQLNAFLEPYGLIFPIDISSSSRATIGGMVATDASGKGSLIYGKTSDHIESLDVVLQDGKDYLAQKHSVEDLSQQQSSLPDFLLPIFHQLSENESEIEKVFPDIPRGMSGYDIKNAIAETNLFNPCHLISGSEGTLAITKKITLRLTKRPAHKMLTVIFYDEFEQGLKHIDTLLQSKPAAIELLDDRTLHMAQSDSVWYEVEKILGEQANKKIDTVNYVEHFADSEQELDQYKQQLQKILQESEKKFGIVAHTIEQNPKHISSLWLVRKRAVGLLGKSMNGRRGIAFVEDTAVPPENLVSYINGFRAILDQQGVDYGMYGHADAGVLHVRPALDMLQQDDRDLIRTISDQVAQLALDNGGVLWGEHGRGLRGEYMPGFFGKKLYRILQDIKNYFDPYNLLNPGKLVTPGTESELIKIDQIQFRGELDQQLNTQYRQDYASTLACNGNGACFSWDISEAMCPSFKATKNKLYSPKGRAAMLREWSRLQSVQKPSAELEESLYHSLEHCLSCKSCTASCSLKVDIPELKSKFLQYYYSKHGEPSGSFVIKHFENLCEWGATAPTLSNLLLQTKPAKWFLKSASRIERLPRFSTETYQKARFLSYEQPADQLPGNSVILVTDSYLHHFNREILEASYQLLQKFGLTVYLSDPVKSGKLLHVKGYRELFKIQAKNNIEYFQQLASRGATLVSTETVGRLMVDMEYPQSLEQDVNIRIHSIESLLAEHMAAIVVKVRNPNKPALLLPHCMEQTLAKQSADQWQTIFDSLQIPLQVINAGCCGMSGIFGHESNNTKLADVIFSLNWQNLAQQHQQSHQLLATGFSCRCQLSEHSFSSQHPVEYLNEIIEG